MPPVVVGELAERLRVAAGGAAARDDRDSGHGRTTLEAAPGATPLDTTGLSIDEVVARIVEMAGR